MKKYSVSENQAIIREVAVKNREDVCLLLAKAKVESGFNNLAKSPSGSYVGLYQLSDGYSGVRGDNRLDPYKNTQGAIDGMKRNRDIIKSKLGYCEDWMLYLAHQQGAAGFVYSFQNQHEKFQSAKYYKNMSGNIPKECRNSIKTTRDFIDCWKGKIKTLHNNCKIENGEVVYSDFSLTKLLPFLVAVGAGYGLYKLYNSK